MYKARNIHTINVSASRINARAIQAIADIFFAYSVIRIMFKRVYGGPEIVEA